MLVSVSIALALALIELAHLACFASFSSFYVARQTGRLHQLGLLHNESLLVRLWWPFSDLK